MTIFIRLLDQSDKNHSLVTASSAFRAGEQNSRVFEVSPNEFHTVPGCSFVYWVGSAVRSSFSKLPSFESDGREVRQGLVTADDFRFVRTWWEVSNAESTWVPYVKGSHVPFCAEVPMVVNWTSDGKEICGFADPKTGKTYSRPQNTQYYFLPGVTWPSRPHRRGYFSHVSPGAIFSHTGTMLFCSTRSAHWAMCALLNSDAYIGLLHLLMPRGGGDSGQTLKYEVGYVKAVPIPKIPPEIESRLSQLAQSGWELVRRRRAIEETAHEFHLPVTLRKKAGRYDPDAINIEINGITAEIDSIAFRLYGFAESDRQAVQSALIQQKFDADDKEVNEDVQIDASPLESLLAWTVGVAFGRFDLRLATGERQAPPGPDPFDPLPSKSPGMLPDGTEPFHDNSGILVDDQGHPDDLAHLVEEVLARVDISVPEDVRRWLRRDFFAFHLQRYSKNRRKAPIYCPLSTTSGSYTLWVYYPSLTSQTLYTANNDFVEPKLKQVGANVTALNNKGSERTSDDEKQFEALQAFELELIELRDTLLKLAPTYKPNHDDGVQISAAPLWPLFRHKPWQKVLKDTWAKLEKGEYDWAHLAMNYWPDRVREKCKTDKSLAIAHGLEDSYIEPETTPKKARGRKKPGGDE